ncbi:MAG: hypothetical protein A3J38_08820 [Gammaproteobacteria bacterium RIFCSPHIGHO2_12_FULL_45_9]|nr:MAG: hypothetical protein A3J38_08820 [Gammaproteobacteria bacterium RIFCSPHIGHO2_12_FULL_45_9]
MDKIFETVTGFLWDKGNQNKNWLSHGVLPAECEQVFFNKPLLLYEDLKHSGQEQRHYVLGKTEGGRRLFIAFTVRKDLIRVISARDMSKKERGIYEK